jgi:nitroreductase
MTNTPNSEAQFSDASVAVPTTAEALGRLDMPLLEAMMTQRAVRRVLPEPVDDEVVLKCIELALRAPTGANGQNWEFIVVKDRQVKEKLARRYRRRGSSTTPSSSGASPRATSRWQRSCVRSVAGRPLHRSPGPRRGLPAPRRPRGARALHTNAAASGVRLFRIDLPSVQNLLLAARAMGLGASLITFAAVECVFGAPDPQSAAVRDTMLRRAARLAARALRAYNTQTCPRGDPPRRVRQPRLARHLIRSPSVARPGKGTWPTVRAST